VKVRVEKWSLGIFLLVAIGMVALLVVRWALDPADPSIEIADASEALRTVTLHEIRSYPSVERRGSYQNQFGNWSDDALYVGALLGDLLREPYDRIEVVASDGYRVSIDRTRIEDLDYPMVLAYCVDGRCVPDLEEGFRIAVLPEDGAVSNEEYGVESAGSYWVRDVVRLELE